MSHSDVRLNASPSSLKPSDRGDSASLFTATDVEQAWNLGALAARAQYERELNVAPPPYSDNASVRTFNTLGTTRSRKVTLDEKAAQDMYVGWSGAHLGNGNDIDPSDKSIRSVRTTNTSLTTSTTFTARTGYTARTDVVPFPARRVSARSREHVERLRKVLMDLKDVDESPKTKTKWSKSLKKTVSKVIGGKLAKENARAGEVNSKSQTGEKEKPLPDTPTPATTSFTSSRERKTSSKSNFEFCTPTTARRLAETGPAVAGQPTPFLMRRPRNLSTSTQATLNILTSPASAACQPDFNSISSVEISLLVAASRSASEYRSPGARAQRVRRSRSFSGFTRLAESRLAEDSGEGRPETEDKDGAGVNQEQELASLASIQRLFGPRDDDENESVPQESENSTVMKESESPPVSEDEDDPEELAMVLEAQQLLDDIGMQWEYV